MSASQGKTILYGRLSHEDDTEGESNSIQNQRIYLEAYAAEHGFTNTIFIYDDGYSGTNFDRPGWNEVLELIEADQVDTLIVKDLSRLGRHYLWTGYYMDMYLPSKGVRFIAIANGVDSSEASTSDFTPIINWCNEQHPKETSRKVRQVKHSQNLRGERTGSKPPYGYRKESADSKVLVPEEETAPIVQQIFQLCASGKGPCQIARILTEAHVLNPTSDHFRRTGAGRETAQPDFWGSSTVAGILENVVYLGHTLSEKTTTISYKNKKRLKVPKEKQILTENTHEPLISEDLWAIVQSVRSHKHRPPKPKQEPGLFSGIAYCADCGKPLTLVRGENLPPSRYYLKCSTYGRQSKSGCTPHRIKQINLEAVVLSELRMMTALARTHEREFADFIHQRDSQQMERDLRSQQKEIARMERRLRELEQVFKKLYEDNVFGRITDDQFQMLSKIYTEERNTLNAVLPAKIENLNNLKQSASNVETFITKAKQAVDIEELTPELLRLFIQRIEVGERAEKGSRSSPQSIHIIYRDIGDVDLCQLEEK